MNTDPRCTWTGRELAKQLKVKLRNLLTQLGKWTRLGFLTRTRAKTYAFTLDTPP